MSGAVFAVSGCSTSSQTDGVWAAAQGFYSALAASNGTEACALLSPEARTDLEQSAGTACPEALLGEDLPEPGSLDAPRVYGTMAIVSGAGDTMFLSRFPEGWLVTGVGCDLTDQADRYDCAVGG